MAPTQCLVDLLDLGLKSFIAVHTVLDEDIETLLHEQSGIKDDKTETKRQDIVTRADFKECAYRPLRLADRVSHVHTIRIDDQH